MGSRDNTVSLQVAFLNRVGAMRLVSSSNAFKSYVPDPDGDRVDSYFEQYTADNDCSISWSGVNLNEQDGWKSIAGGSLFIRSNYKMDVYSPVREQRDDVDKLGADSYVYRNGYKIASSHDSGIYHIVLPEHFHPTSIEYPTIGELLLLNARIVDGRSVFTWVFKNHFQVVLHMKGPNWKTVPISRNNLFEIALKNVPENVLKRTKTKQTWAEKAVDLAVSAIPSIFKVM